MDAFGVFYGILRAWNIINKIMNAGHDGIKLWMMRIGPVRAHHKIATRELRSARPGCGPAATIRNALEATHR